MKPSAVFLDRDGVVLELVDHLHRAEDMRLAAGMAEAIRSLNVRAIPVVVITNQSVVARGLISESGLRVLHGRLATLLAQSNARLDAIYYCPHHPDVGEPPYRAHCVCRKPAPGLILQAARELNIDLARSVLIGDTLSDIEAARRAGVGRAVLVRTGYGASEEARISEGGTPPADVRPDAPTAIAEILEDCPPR